MKKLSLLFVVAIAAIALNAQTVTIVTNKAMVDSSLFEMVYNNVFNGTFTNPTKSNGYTTYTVDLIKWNPNESELDTILNTGGSVSQSLLVIKFPQSSLGAAVSSSFDYYQYVGASGLTTMNYAFWFKRTGLYAYNSYCYVLTQNWVGEILTGTEIKQILNLSANAELMGLYDEEFIEATENGIKAF